MSQYPPTAEQQIAIDIAKSGKTMKLLAFAGAGKTSTLVFVAKALGKLGKKGIYLAFNKDIAKEANAKMPSNVRAMTFHSMALSQMPVYKKRLEKEFAFKDFIKKFGIEPLAFYAQGQSGSKKEKKLVTLSEAAQKSLIDRTLSKFYTDDESVSEPTDQHMKAAIEDSEFGWSLDPLDIKALCAELMPVVRDLWVDFSNPAGEIGLAGRHDVYLKMWAMSRPQIETDFILFDEAQDADPIMTTVLTSQSCQVIYVGDPYQQIYSFRGAVNVMQLLEVPEAQLTQSFRFGDELAKCCQPVLNALGCQSKIRGLIDKPTQIYYREPTPDGEGAPPIDAILCRTNTHAVVLSIISVQNIKKNGGAKENLILPLNLSFKETKDMMFAIAKLKKGVSDHPKLVGFRDYSDLLQYAKDYPQDTEISSFVRMYMTVGMKNVLEAIEMVENIKPGSHKGPVVTTAHRSKGLEWDHCLLASDMAEVWGKPDEPPSPIECHENYEDELRLLYVAMTRAKKSLWLGSLSGFLQELAVTYNNHKTVN